MIVTSDQTVIVSLAHEILRAHFFLPGQMAEKCFRGEFPIYRLAYEPNIGWAMAHEYADPKKSGCLSAFVSESKRRQGYATGLVDALIDGYVGPKLTRGLSTTAGVAFSKAYFTPDKTIKFS